MGNMKDAEIAIVGGGISGVVLSLALIRLGYKIQIYEQAHVRFQLIRENRAAEGI
jgi:2-polyprenyl-6-methoxyphenol hydroxylase-like FAD-dependent oxidoreductase